VIAIPAGLGHKGTGGVAAGQRAGANVSPADGQRTRTLESLAETARVAGVPVPACRLSDAFGAQIGTPNTA
jgi:hypothetical protein